MKVSKGLEFPVVALPGVGHMPAPGEDEKEAARVFYVAATRATQRLVITASGNGGFFQKLAPETTTQNGERHQQILDVTVEPSVLGFAVQSTQNSLYP